MDADRFVAIIRERAVEAGNPAGCHRLARMIEEGVTELEGLDDLACRLSEEGFTGVTGFPCPSGFYIPDDSDELPPDMCHECAYVMFDEADLFERVKRPAANLLWEYGAPALEAWSVWG